MVWPPAIGMPAARHTDAPPSRMRPMVRGGQHVDRHAHQRQRQDRPAAHRIDVADRVGGGDAAEVERVVDDRHEEVGGGDQRLLVVELVDGGVVGGLDADQQLLGHRHRRRALEDLATARRARSCSRSRRRATARSGGVRRVFRGRSSGVLDGVGMLKQVGDAAREQTPRVRALGCDRTAARAAALRAPDWRSIAGLVARALQQGGQRRSVAALGK